MRGLRPAATAAKAFARASLLPQTSRRAFTATTSRKAGAHGPQFDPPTGWLWGVKPGEKVKKEGWEDTAFYGFVGSLLVFSVFYAFKPDTSIQTWALEEARRRLEAEGILEDPQNKK